VAGRLYGLRLGDAGAHLARAARQQAERDDGE